MVEDRDAEHTGQLVEEHHRGSKRRLELGVFTVIGHFEVLWERILLGVVQTDPHIDQQDGRLTNDRHPERNVEDGRFGLDL